RHRVAHIRQRIPTTGSRAGAWCWSSVASRTRSRHSRSRHIYRSRTEPAQVRSGPLYGAAPVAAFVVEILYGVFCWWVYRGGRGLLAVIVLFNIANLSLLSAAVPGPEEYLAADRR